jgi:DNA helicase II / ATP-dependent DNA helicase PcrA
LDKRIIFAVAGSGKTTYIVDSLNEEDRFLVLTYTLNNLKNISDSIKSRFGYFPDNIEIFTYFKFLYSFCFAPFLSYELDAKGLYWDFPPTSTLKLRRSNPSFYQTRDGRLYHNRLAKLLEIKKLVPDIIKRIEKYYDHLCIDEVQDFGGHDFNLLSSILTASIDVLLLGDFYQHTFDTSRDAKTNEGLHNNYQSYIKKFTDIGLTVDVSSLGNSYRCSPQICGFITLNLNIDIESHRSDETEVIEVTDMTEAEILFHDDSVIKLFYNGSSNYPGYTKNWGDCKGENCYEDVCVLLNKKSYDLFQKGRLDESVPLTKNKLYVAFSRTRNNLYILPETLIVHHKVSKK